VFTEREYVSKSIETARKVLNRVGGGLQQRHDARDVSAEADFRHRHGTGLRACLR
jgi:hypothetical protein